MLKVKFRVDIENMVEVGTPNQDEEMTVGYHSTDKLIFGSLEEMGFVNI